MPPGSLHYITLGERNRKMIIDDTVPKKAIETAKKCFPHLVAEDFEFPRLEGYEESRRLRNAFWIAKRWLSQFKPIEHGATSGLSSNAIIRRLVYQYDTVVPREILIAAAHHLGFPIFVDERDVWIGIGSANELTEPDL